MIYPKSFETKIGFDGVRQLLHEHCLSTLGKQMVDEMAPTSKHADVDEWLSQVREFRQIQQKADDFPLLYFFDLRQSISRLRIDGTHLDEQELFDLKRSLETITAIVSFLNRTESGADGGSDGTKDYAYPTLHKLALGVMIFPEIIRDIDRVLDKYGKIKDNASPHLLEIRRELAKAEGSV